MKLTVEMAPAKLPQSRIEDVALEVTVENTGSAESAIYAALSAVRPRGFPYGPCLFAEAPQLIELRTYYGPPGIPPPNLPSYLAKNRRRIAPRAKLTDTLSACWLPAALLPEGALRADVLDPNAMDGLQDPSFKPDEMLGVLVFEPSSSILPIRRQDFLRPPAGHHESRMILFVPRHGGVRVKFGYRHFKESIQGATADCALESELVVTA